MRWNEIDKIVEALEESRADRDVKKISLVKLHKYIISLLDFDDNPTYFSERILESIQQEWRDVRNEEE